MAGIFQFAQLARTANARIQRARELEARFKALPPEEQEAAKVEIDAVKAALKSVRARLEAGPRGFVREFNAAYKGEEADAAPELRPLGELVTELTQATKALKRKLDAAEAQAAADAAPPADEPR